jgi:serine/threonine protein kinase
MAILKLMDLRQASPERLERLRRESLVLGEIRSSAVPRVIDFGGFGESGRFEELPGPDGFAWLALKYVPGVTLEKRLVQGPLGVEEVLFVARAALEALGEVHERGILHRDLKPSNLIVNESGPLRELTLIDFGLARAEQVDTRGSTVPAGTVRYMAPEQSKALGREIGPFSDLYSLGAILHECLSGHPLFSGEDAGEVLRKHLNLKPPPLREVAAGGTRVPRALDQWIQRLLRKDPSSRYPTACAALEGLKEAEKAWQREDWEAELSSPGWEPGQPETALDEPEFVGREAELRILASAWEQTCQGRGGLVLLEGESGGGKTRLLSEFARRLPWVLRGQAVNAADQGPFQLLSNVVAGVLERARTR